MGGPSGPAQTRQEDPSTGDSRRKRLKAGGLHGPDLSCKESEGHPRRGSCPHANGVPLATDNRFMTRSKSTRLPFSRAWAALEDVPVFCKASLCIPPAQTTPCKLPKTQHLTCPDPSLMSVTTLRVTPEMAPTLPWKPTISGPACVLHRSEQTVSGHCHLRPHWLLSLPTLSFYHRQRVTGSSNVLRPITGAVTPSPP